MLSSRSHGWPVGDTAVRAEPRVEPFPHAEKAVRWTLVVGAFLCGLAVSGAIFAYAWRHESSGRQAAQSRLGSEYAKLAGYQHQIASLRGRIAQAERTARTQAQAIATRDRRISALAAGQRSEHARLLDAASAAASAARAASTLEPEVATLSGYVRSAPSLDPGYLQSQLAYLGRQIVALRAEAERLAALG